ncbi:MAG TPA: S41 family peptidase, partial [Dehalococcoidia bacterium]|nr:S41 family peptidase [Dehalococcoidia bacterium]
PAMQRIAGLFVSEGSPLVTVTSRSGSTTALDSIGTPLDTQRPLVILTSSATASSAEMLTEALRQLGRATVVGTTTAGCVNGGYLVGLLDGSGVMVSTQRVLVGRGRVALEGIGIAPDINCSRTQDDLVAGRDPQLDEALAALNRPLPNP